MSLKPICVHCRRFMRPEKNGVYFIEGARFNGGWEPYKLWMGDLWRCPGCGTESIVGVGRQPVSERHHTDFADAIRKSKATIQINDC